MNAPHPRAMHGLAAAVLILAGTAVLPAQDTVSGLKERIIDIQNKGKLGFRNFTLCRSVSSFGQFARHDGSGVPAGATVYFYYEPENVFTERERGSYRVWYAQDIVVLARDGTELLRVDEALSFTYLGYAPVLDLYATNRLELGDLPPGQYRYRAVLRDKLKGVEAATELSFTIVKAE